MTVHSETQSPDTGQNPIQVRTTPLYGGFALAFGVLILVLGILTLAVPNPNRDLLIASLQIAGGALFAIVGYYAMIHRDVRIEISDKGIFVAQHKVTIPWMAIQRIELIDLNIRKSTSQKVTEAAIYAAAGKGGANRAMTLIAVSFTDAGRAHFAGRKFESDFIRKSINLRDDEDLLIRTHGLDWHSRQAPFKNPIEMVNNLQQLIEAGGKNR